MHAGVILYIKLGTLVHSFFQLDRRAVGDVPPRAPSFRESSSFAVIAGSARKAESGRLKFPPPKLT